jgi:crotonobetainyl-CoA:carnitine CoA-transferase CaiB-like acyl-CoA transferase
VEVIVPAEAGALDELRILDFTQGIAGPMACMLLADLGAEVIKVEPPCGDRMRAQPGYLVWNRNKQRLVLDICAGDGRSTALDLLATADVAVFDDNPGELEQLGLAGSALVTRHPALLHVWMPPYGVTGPWSALPASDSLLSAVSGVSCMQSGTGDRPVHLVLPQVTYGHALIAATAIAAGLYERARSGRGQALTVSGLHGVAAMKTGGAVHSTTAPEGAAAGRGKGITYGPHYRAYRCADGERLFLGCLTERFYVRALELLGLPELFTMAGVDGSFKKVAEPPMNQVAIDRLDARFGEKPRAEWMRLLHDPLVPLTPVDTRETWFHGETVTANEMRVEIDHPELGTVEMAGVPVRFSMTPGRVRHLLRPATAGELPSHTPTVPGAGSAPASLLGGGPLAGIRVLDLATFIAGSLTSTVLASLGADVVKIEPPEGDPWRTQDLGFIPWNRGKRGLVLDLKHPDGREAFHDLVRRADIVTDNYRVGVRERLRIDHASLAEVNPHIITCSGLAYGPVGARAREPGFDTVLQALSGIAIAQGGPDEPVTMRMSPIDSATAIMTALGAAVALYVRERTGRGQQAWTSLANTVVLCQSGELVSYAGRPANPVGGRDCVGVGALHRFYRCADGWIALACTAPEHWPGLCLALDHPEWAGEMTAGAAATEARDGRLADTIAGAVAGLTRETIVDRLAAQGVPAAPVVTHAEVFTDPFLRENRFLDAYEHPEYGMVHGVRGYASFSRTPGGFTRRAPLLGEHSVEVLREAGFDDGRVARLLADGLVRQPTGEAISPRQKTPARPR